MSRAISLYRRYTMAELTAMQKAICDDPANANPGHTGGGSIYLYTAKARKKLDDIAWAISYHMADRKEAREA